MMYRCSNCDAPAWYGCDCHTEFGRKSVDHGVASESGDALRRATEREQAQRATRTGVPQERPRLEVLLNESLEVAKLDVSSGEDAGFFIREAV